MKVLAASLVFHLLCITHCVSFQLKPQYNTFSKRYGSNSYSLQSCTKRIFPKSNLSASATPNIDPNQSIDTSNQNRFRISTKSYEHEGWTLTYKHKEWDPNYPNDNKVVPPLLLIHPVGIGLSNWFWDRVIDLWEGEVYAPNLIGCARDGIGDTWDPQTRGLFLPLDWARGCETLIQEQITKGNTDNDKRQCIVVTQGGLAPVGVVLAHRDTVNECGNIKGLVLTSPQTWKDMIGFVPQNELEKNFNFLSSPILGELAFRILETRGAIQFFSDLFLFQDKCDEEWLDKATFDSMDNNAVKSNLLRPPVMSFNAGMLNARSFLEEMTEISQPTLILSGEGDKRTKDRVGYVEGMKKCTMESMMGCNVLPFENPQGVCKAILNFL